MTYPRKLTKERDYEIRNLLTDHTPQELAELLYDLVRKSQVSERTIRCTAVHNEYEVCTTCDLLSIFCED
jgi:hypothetical protein